MKDTDALLTDLLAHEAWIRVLARHLVRNEDGAEDVAQDTWVQAMRSPPSRSGSFQGWLRRVAQSVAFRRWRSDAHRRAREEAVARPERAPSVSDVLDREAMRFQVAKVVCSLEEPYRSAILCRYFDGLPPREIAACLGISRAAVETQLKRGLQQLRARLDRDFGDRRSWCAALLPLIGQVPTEAAAAAGATTTASILTGALVMSTKIKIGIAVLLAAACAIAFWLGQEEPGTTAPEMVQDADVEATVPGASEKPDDSAPREPVVANASDEPPTDRGTTVSGIVVDYWTQRPVPEASVSLFRGRQPAGEGEWAHADLEAQLGPGTVSGKDGRFRLEVPAAPDSTGTPSVMTLFAHAEGYPMQHFDEVPADAREARLNLKAGRRLSGRTVDEEGGPVASAALVLRIWCGLLGSLTSQSKSEADGTFVLDGVPSRSFITVEVHAAGFVPRLLYFWLEESPGELIVKLSRGREINGRVIDSETREPIEGVSVGLWVREHFGTRALQRMKTGGDGGYRFEHVEALAGLERDPWQNRPLGRPPGSRCLGLWADAAGYAPAWAAIEFGRTQDIELYRSGAVEGLVLNARGEPMAGARVEAYTRPDVLVRAPGLQSRIFDDRAREPWAGLWIAVTGEDGRYRLERVASPPASGRILNVSVTRTLWERPFPLTHVVVVPGETVTAPPMTNPDPLPAWIHGRTVDNAGQPVGGVLVRTYGSDRALTGDDGRFRIPYPIPEMGGSEMYLYLSHCDFLSRTVPVSRAWRDGRELLLRLERGVELSGTVVDRHGRGVAGASIRVREGDEPIAMEDLLWRHGTGVHNTISRHEGTFSTRVAPGPIQVLVTYPEWFRGPFCARFSLSAVASAGTMVLPLASLDLAEHRPVTLRIRVVDEATGKTVDRPLSANLLSEIGPWTREDAKGADGTLVIQNVPAPLEYELQLRVWGFGTVRRRIFVSSQSDIAEHVIAIGGGGGVLRGTIIGADGLPQLPRVVVTAESGDQAVVPLTADGRFELRGLEAGTYVVELDAWHFPKDPVAAAPARVTVPPAGTASVELTAEKAGVLCVYPLSPDREPNPPEPVTYRPRREVDEMSDLGIDRWKRRGLSMLVRDRAGRIWYRGIPLSRFLVPEGVYDVTYFRHGEVVGSGTAPT
ncbi:MAG: sigma-70 family RNA polymerase sigma factor, partial [Planctomycetes bacterium]|nr:sigma-70 family RNA polymerase sigma factor [Planctomycetota bacterium]